MVHSVAKDDGHIVCAAGDGSGVEVIVPVRVTFILKQLEIDMAGERLDWTACTWRRWCKERQEGCWKALRGVCIDTARMLLYRTQKVSAVAVRAGQAPVATPENANSAQGAVGEGNEAPFETVAEYKARMKALEEAAAKNFPNPTPPQDHRLPHPPLQRM